MREPLASYTDDELLTLQLVVEVDKREAILKNPGKTFPGVDQWLTRINRARKEKQHNPNTHVDSKNKIPKISNS